MFRKTDFGFCYCELLQTIHSVEMDRRSVTEFSTVCRKSMYLFQFKLSTVTHSQALT